MRLPDLPQRAHPLAHAPALMAGLGALAVALLFPAEGLATSMFHFRWIAAGSLVLFLFLVARVGLWTAAGAYAAVFWCFHFGLISVLAAGLVEPREISIWNQLWLFGPFGADAGLLALLGFAGFAAGASLAGSRRASAAQEDPVGDEGAHSHGTAGAVLVLISILTWCAIVIVTAGFSGFLMSYGEYLYATAGFSTPLGLVWLALGCGTVMMLTGRRGWLRLTTIGALAGMAVVALPLGLRGELMFPAIAAIVAAARCGWVLSPARACGLIVALLLIIPTVREVRTTGLQGVPDMVLELRLFDAFVEMGGSLHPVEKVARWHAEGESMEWGASYWAPIERAASRVLPGLRTPAAEDDMRLMNVLVTDRVGPIGFSPVAEAYRNFGPVGVVVILGLLGAALARLDRLADRRLAVLAIAVLYVPVLVNVRNSFVSVPLQCGLGVLFVTLLQLSTHMLGSIKSRADARALYPEAKPWSL